MRKFLVAALLFLPLSGTAQVRPIVDDAEADLWRAVGVVTVDRQPICTGTLIAPDRVLTAAHCIYAGYSTRLLAPETVGFRAGWRGGISVARRQAVRITAHRKYDPVANYRSLSAQAERNIAYDLAIIQLDMPIAAEQVMPMPMLNRVRDGDRYDLVSYGDGGMDYPSIQEGCRFVDNRTNSSSSGMSYGRRSSVLRLNCGAVPGNSGAPVFGYLMGKPQIVLLISNMLERRGGDQVALGIVLGKTLQKLIADRDAQNSGFVQTPPFWDTGRPARAATQIPTPERRIVRPGGGLKLPQN